MMLLFIGIFLFLMLSGAIAAVALLGQAPAENNDDTARFSMEVNIKPTHWQYDAWLIDNKAGKK